MPSQPNDRPPLTCHLAGSTGGRIRRLSGFRQGHFVPDTPGDAARDFVRRIGHGEVRALAEGLHRDLRETFGFKRRGIDYCCDDGTARIVTALFEADVAIGQDPEAPDRYRLAVELRGRDGAPVADDPRMHACFNPHCDTVVVEFPGSFDVPAAIDRIEDIDGMRHALDYPADASRFELRPPGLDLHIEVTADHMTLQLLDRRDLARLIDASRRALDALAPAGLNLRIAEP
jgi:hypothetical protein